MLTKTEYEYLLSVEAIQQRARQIFQLALANQTHFQLRLEKLPAIADLVVKIIYQNYPYGNIPLHSRWRHFVVNGQDRSQALAQLPPLLQAKARMDLAMISVLLDAGAGQVWTYRDHQGQIFSRSEGLAIASLELFLAGFFSSDPSQPWQVDAQALQQLTLSQLAEGLQVGEYNPLLGLDGRWQLLQKFAKILASNHAVFNEKRPAGIIAYLAEKYSTKISASDLVKEILWQLNSIWPGRIIDGFSLGDVWLYAPLGWVPFHKLSLWLTLSLIEPLQMANINIVDIDQLPGLAEYRNGGLFVDGGVLVIKNSELILKEHQPGDEIIVEWRALTLALLERLAPLIREKLCLDQTALPLVNILQGGTWQAGRELAKQRSAGAESPIKYCSTGTLF